MLKKVYFILFGGLLLTLLPSVSHAGEQGHYYPGIFALRDYVVPPKGVYTVFFDPYYAAREFKNGAGEAVNSIGVSGGTSRTVHVGLRSHPITITAAANIQVDLDIAIDSVIQQPALIWSSGWEFFGADHAAIVAVPFGYMRMDIEADVNAAATVSIAGQSRTITGSRKIKVEDDKYGFGDMLVIPVMLGWHGKHYDVTSVYGFVAPTGAYDEGDIANIGMGFWSHWWQQALYYYPFDMPSTAFAVMGTYELNSYKYDKDVRPGSTVTVEYGVSQYLHERFEIGVNGYHQWQVTDDAGSQAFNSSLKDSMNGAGASFTLWLKKQKLALVGKINVEYGVRDRFEGYMSSVNLLWAFGDALQPQETS